MAWNIHWQIPFQSLEGVNYTLNIYQDGYTGSIVTLTGDKEVFVTQEDSNTEVTKYIRTQTGYIRVITDSQSLMENMIPSTSTSNFVRLMQGNSVKWQGFMKPQAFSQPYNEYMWKIEFPVQSIIMAISDIDIDKNNVPTLASLYTIIGSIFNNCVGNIPNVFGNITFVSSVNGFCMATPPGRRFIPEDYDPIPQVTADLSVNGWWDSVIDMSSIVEYIEVKRGSRNYTTESISSVKDFVENICRIFNCIYREYGDSIIFADYFYTDSGKTRTVRYSGVDFLAGIYSTPTINTLNPISIDESDYRGNSNKVGYTEGYNNVTVNFSLSDAYLRSEMPTNFMDDETIIEYSDMQGTRHAADTQLQNTDDMELDNETFTYYRTDDPAGTVTISSCSCADFISHYPAQHDIETDEEEHIIHWYEYYGACPCMCSRRNPDGVSDFANLRSALYFRGYSLAETAAYEIKSSSMYHKGSYIHLKIKTENHLEDSALSTTLYFYVKCGNKYLSGNTWVDNFSTTRATTNTNGELPTNETGWYLEEEGYFIEVPFDGIISIGLVGGDPMLITELSISEYVDFKNFFQYGDSTKNLYSQTTGFASNKDLSINVKYGTLNGNKYSPSLLRYFHPEEESYTYIKKLFYIGMAAPVRPEVYMLDRLVAYYAKRRRHLSLEKEIIDVWEQLVIHNGIYYVGIAKKREWANDKQDTLLIEITTKQNENN